VVGGGVREGLGGGRSRAATLLAVGDVVLGPLEALCEGRVLLEEAVRKRESGSHQICMRTYTVRHQNIAYAF
jgi:hypothetical protein